MTTKIPKPAKHYFLVRISKNKQKDRQEKIGRFYLPVQKEFLGMTRNMQCGEIVDIGENAAKDFPEAAIGDVLLFHHFIEAEKYCVHGDSDFNYYIVPPYVNKSGLGYEAVFGIFNGTDIVPHKSRVFLYGPEKIDRTELSKKESLFLFANYKMTKDEIIAKLAELKEELDHMSKGNMARPEQMEAMLAKQNYMSQLSAMKDKEEYLPFKVKYSNPLLEKWFGRKIKDGDTLYCLSIATDYLIEFNGIEYRVVETEDIGGLAA